MRDFLKWQHGGGIQDSSRSYKVQSGITKESAGRSHNPVPLDHRQTAGTRHPQTHAPDVATCGVPEPWPWDDRSHCLGKCMPRCIDLMSWPGKQTHCHWMTGPTDMSWCTWPCHCDSMIPDGWFCQQNPLCLTRCPQMTNQAALRPTLQLWPNVPCIHDLMPLDIWTCHHDPAHLTWHHQRMGPTTANQCNPLSPDAQTCPFNWPTSPGAPEN